MRVKSRKPPAENLITSDRVTCLQVGGGADDVVGDQMRQMAGDGEHQVVVLRRHGLDLGAEHRARTRRASRPRSGRCPSGGVRMHQRPSNNSAKPASGPECSVPAIGWAGTKCTAFGRCGGHVAHDRALDRADIGEDRARFRCGAISSATAPQAPTGTQTMTSSAPSTASAVVSATLSAMPSSTHALAASPASAMSPRSSAPRARALAARTIEEPIRPEPDNGDGVEDRLASCARRLVRAQERLERVEHRAFSSSVPTVMRSASGKPYSATRRRMIRRSMEERVGVRRGLARRRPGNAPAGNSRRSA